MISHDAFSSPPPSLHLPITNPNPNSSNSAKRKRNLPGNPDPDAEVIALSPKSLMETNRFVCEICSKGFQRDQNLQLHRRGHNLPWKLKQRNKQEVVRKKVYICPEISCVHHDPSRALGDLTGVKKHFSRKHGEKKWKCGKCSKKYAVHSDWKAHTKICGTKEYKCDCGTLFSRKDSFITHRAFCDALTEDNTRMASFMMSNTANLGFQNDFLMTNNGGRVMEPGIRVKPELPIWMQHHDNNPLEINSTTSSSFLGSSSLNNNNIGGMLSQEMVEWLSRNRHESVESFVEVPRGILLKDEEENKNTKGEIQLNDPMLYINYGGGCCPNPPPYMSATALLQKASQIGPTRSTNLGSFGLMSTSDQLYGFNTLSQCENSGDGTMSGGGLMMMMAGETRKTGEGSLTRDFLGVEGDERRVFSMPQELMKFTCSMNIESSIGFSGSQS